MVKIFRISIITIMWIWVASCGKEQGQPICGALLHVVSDYIQRYNNYDLYLLGFYNIGNLNTVTIQGSPSYDGNLTDGYFCVDGKNVLFCMFDKKERSDILFRRNTCNIDYSSPWMSDRRNKDYFHEPHVEAYWIKNAQEIVPYDEIPSDYKYWTLAKGNNAIMNCEMNRILNEFINKHKTIAYYMRFNHYEGNDYVTIGFSFYYDKDKIDGYFLRNGHIVILYDVEKLKDRGLVNQKDVMKNWESDLQLHEKEEKTSVFGPHIEKYRIDHSGLQRVDGEESFYPYI